MTTHLAGEELVNGLPPESLTLKGVGRDLPGLLLANGESGSSTLGEVLVERLLNLLGLLLGDIGGGLGGDRLLALGGGGLRSVLLGDGVLLTLDLGLGVVSTRTSTARFRFSDLQSGQKHSPDNSAVPSLGPHPASTFFWLSGRGPLLRSK
jgi:hypothetical protein